MKNSLIKEAVRAAGGSIEVSKALGVTDEAVRRWKRGLPRTEWTGETNYLIQIEALQRIRSGQVLISAASVKAAQVWRNVAT